MADENEAKNQTQEQQKESKVETGDKNASGGILQWIIMVVVVISGAGSGFGLGRLVGASGKIETTGGLTKPEDITANNTDSTGTKSKETWFYDLEPVVANLDSPGVTRYVRVTLTLEINPRISAKKGTALIEEKKPLLTNWLTIYLAGLGLEEIRGDRNLKRVQSEILDAFNEKLFPDAKPQLNRVLFKEFAIQ